MAEVIHLLLTFLLQWIAVSLLSITRGRARRVEDELLDSSLISSDMMLLRRKGWSLYTLKARVNCGLMINQQ
ncbi:hypothetical protein F5050DRAFT_1751664 [Lentinula boryana]|uniref:Uncharacterized protein n=1 Tax=Lentinula boryana TaxID=40481 RepID=A0ABQ8QG55_9AGAR|nr:hypothetical protein F5050DRAFT_1751664 [Lentinula boryana]